MLQPPLSCIPDHMSPPMPGYLLIAMPPKRPTSTQSNYRYGILLPELRFVRTAALPPRFLNGETVVI
jgi:hypothetical protein